MRAWPSALVLLFASIAGCSKGEHAIDEAKEAGPKVEATSDPNAPKPPTQRELPTTDGTIALDNLNTSIRGVEASLAQRLASAPVAPSASAAPVTPPPAPASAAPKAPKASVSASASAKVAITPPAFDLHDRRALVDLLLTRADVTGKLADYDRAVAVAEDAVRAHPNKWEALLIRAAVHSALHRFSAALTDVAEAKKLGAKPDRLQAIEASALAGKGDLDAALALRKASREAWKNTETLGAEAALLAEMGKIDEAAKLFREAEQSYRNVSPFAVVWLLLEQGRMWDRAGKRDLARAYMEEAHARLPMHAHVATHLAALVSAERAIEILEPIVITADDPSVLEVMARRLEQQGDKARASAMLDRVKARYDEVLGRYPEAFAEHAGFFFLDFGKDPKRALDLAKKDLAARKTAKAYELALLAAKAAGAKDDACAFGKEAQKLAYASPVLREIAAGACR